MRLFLAILLSVFAVVYVVLGVPALVLGEDDVTRPSVSTLTRSKSLEPMKRVEVSDGVIVLADDPSLHFVGGVAVVPLVTDETAVVIAEHPGFDLAAARAANGTRRVVLVEMSDETFRRVIRDNGAAPSDRIVGPFVTRGSYQQIEDRTEAFRTVADRLGLETLEVVALQHSTTPRDRVFGGVALALALVCGLGARALVRSRRRSIAAREEKDAAFRDALGPMIRPHRDPSAPPPTPAERERYESLSTATSGGSRTPSVSGPLLAKIAAFVAFIGFMVAKVSDTAVRGVDELVSARSARNVDAVPSGSSVRAASTVDEAVVAERIIKTIDTAKKIADVHKFWTTVHGADDTVQAVVVLDDLEERYEVASGGWYDLVSARQSMAGRVGVGGKPEPVTSEVLDELPDRSRGETSRVAVEPPDGQRAGSLLFDSRSLSDAGTWRTSSVRAEVEVVEGSWGAFLRGEPIRLRYTQEGMQAIQAELERVLDETLDEQFPVATFRRTHARVETSVHVAQDSNVSIVATREGVTITSKGPTVIELALGAWR